MNTFHFPVPIILMSLMICFAGDKNPGSTDTNDIRTDTIKVDPGHGTDNNLFFSPFSDSFFTKGFGMSPLFGNAGTELSDDFSSDVDIDVKDDKVLVTAKIPGSDKNNINIDVTGNRISISANMKIENTVKDEKGNVISSSTQMRQFSNSQSLPVEVEPEPVRTEYKNDQLIIELKRKN